MQLLVLTGGKGNPPQKCWLIFKLKFARGVRRLFGRHEWGTKIDVVAKLC